MRLVAASARDEVFDVFKNCDETASDWMWETSVFSPATWLWRATRSEQITNENAFQLGDFNCRVRVERRRPIHAFVSPRRTLSSPALDDAQSRQVRPECSRRITRSRLIVPRWAKDRRLTETQLPCAGELQVQTGVPCVRGWIVVEYCDSVPREFKQTFR